MRLAWFTPLPPVRSGISRYSEEILAALSAAHEIDVFDRARAHGFVPRHLTRPYELTVFQLGNAECHDFMWPYLVRYPGLTVLHDAQLHQSRAAALLKAQRRRDDYRAEFAFNHPGAPGGVAELVIHGLAGDVLHFWPLVRAVIASARTVAVHSEPLAADLREQFPGVAIEHIPMGVPGLPGLKTRPTAYSAGSAGSASTVRARHGIPSDAVVFAAFGRVTPEKRIGAAIRALASVAREMPNVRLMLVGESAAYYDAMAEAQAHGVADRVVSTGYVDDEALGDHIAAADVCLCLRWPTNGETSASWLRCLAAERPTVITDLVHLAHVPSLDPRTWAPVPDAHTGDPMCVSIDILDEDHSLKLAVRRLARDAALRQQLGARAQEYWQAHHTIDRMAEAYERVMADAARRPAPEVALPAHMRADGTELAREILGQFDVAVDLF